MEMKGKLDIIAKESKEYLGNISALELMNDASSFAHELDKLIVRYKLPTSVIVGCLMSAIDNLNAEVNNILLDAHLKKVFSSMKKYMDENFMKKE